MAPSILGGAGWLIGLQVLSRGLTFLVNVALVRTLEPSVLGVCLLQLQLVLSTVQFVSRETFRRACLKEADAQEAWLLSLWSLPFAWLSSAAVPLLFWLSASPEELSLGGYGPFLLLLAAACALELSAEPFFI